MRYELYKEHVPRPPLRRDGNRSPADLLREISALTRELTEAREQQTATSEVLKVISSSPTDIQVVLDIIGERAEKLCEAEISVVSIVEGELIHMASIHGDRGWSGKVSTRISDAAHRRDNHSARHPNL